MEVEATVAAKELELTIRATNGAAWETQEFKSTEKVGHVTRKSVKHFVDAGIMVDGDYCLALVSDGEPPRVLDDSETLKEAGVKDCDVLALVARSPQVDG